MEASPVLNLISSTALPSPPHHPPPATAAQLLLTATTLSQIKQLHSYFLRRGLLTDPLLSRLYNRALIISSKTYSSASSYSPRRALLSYARMRRAGVLPNKFSMPALLGATARDDKDGEMVGREAHGIAVKMGMEGDDFVQTGLVKSYAARGNGDNARKVFERMSRRDVVAWSVMLDGYCQGGHYNQALLLFEEMKSSGVVPDQVILATVLSACGRTGKLMSGKVVHSYILESNIELDAHLHSSLINMYASCGAMDIAQKLYDEICPKNLVASTAMVFGYAKLGKIEDARSIFDRMSDKDLVCWSAMISGYVESDNPGEALQIFNQMQASGIMPDEITMLSVISACAQLGALDQANWIEMFVETNGFYRILSISNALIDMFAKCGCLSSARRIFDKMPRRNVITWTSMITGLAMHGDGRSALVLFDEMKKERVQPNGITFVGMLYACSHSGLVEDGRRIFQSMLHEYNVEPKLEHYGCMVDLLGRAKLLNEAFELINTMPYCPNVIVWGSLLGACRIHGDAELGEIAAKKLLELDPDHDGAYVLLSNIYAKANKWENVREVRKIMKSRGILKERGSSWIEWGGRLHEFAVGDESHPESSEINMKLNEVVKELEPAGYTPQTDSVLIDLDDEEKIEAVLLHSEKLALCFGLIKSGKASCIRIAKNLRVCEDCHSFMKLVSRVYDKEIILRDRTRFHHFNKGLCSCKEFW